MTALEALRQQHRIIDAIHEAIAANPDHRDDPAWLITAVAYSFGVDEATARKVWKAKFADYGVA